MKFEIMFLDQNLEELDFGKSKVKRDDFGNCGLCGCITRWKDVKLNKNICSEECGSQLWSQEFSNRPELVREYNYREYTDVIENEIRGYSTFLDISKDILMVVHNQLEYVKQCIESVQAFTQNYMLHVWDNASDTETKDYLLSLGDKIKLTRSEENLGFIIPNNRMFQEAEKEYTILLNSDTIVSEGWDSVMISYLRRPDMGVVGYLGGVLNSEAVGDRALYGYEIDYVMGWCMCFKRDLSEILFDEENLEFAYCEDADFCLRIKEKGLKCYALHVPLVHHFGNKTANQVAKKRDITETFRKNHLYMKKRWSHILENR